ncbi:unnamed protein product [Amoebophrya sp. A25]|nr:unnamed protein product [Amoebophrya sp. A25]|eukprot:GSA25T00025824001.1
MVKSDVGARGGENKTSALSKRSKFPARNQRTRDQCTHLKKDRKVVVGQGRAGFVKAARASNFLIPGIQSRAYTLLRRATGRF